MVSVFVRKLLKADGGTVATVCPKGAINRREKHRDTHVCDHAQLRGRL